MAVQVSDLLGHGCAGDNDILDYGCAGE